MKRQDAERIFKFGCIYGHFFKIEKGLIRFKIVKKAFDDAMEKHLSEKERCQTCGQLIVGTDKQLAK